MAQEQLKQEAAQPAQPATAGGKRRGWIKRVIQLALLAIVLYFLGRSLYSGFQQAAQSWDGLRVNWLMFGLSLVFVAIHLVLVATAYRATVSSVARPPRWPVMLGITWLSRMGKYIPGKVFSVAGVAWLLRQYGVSGAVATSMVLVNTALAVIVGFTVAAPLIVLDQRIASVLPMPWLWTVLVVAGGLVCVHPRVCFPLMRMVFRRVAGVELSVRPRLRDYLPTCCHMVGQWIFAGLTLYCLCRAVKSDLPAQWGLTGTWAQLGQVGMMASLSALAVTVGFVALFAPGGIGVREAVYLAVLTPVLGLALASVVTVAARLVYTGMEATLALVGLVILKLNPPRVPQDAGGQ